MKKERSINELLKHMLEHQENFKSGLCRWIDNLYLRWEDEIIFNERTKLEKYIEENRPKNIYWLMKKDYYWKENDINPRIKWIKKHIKKTENE